MGSRFLTGVVLIELFVVALCLFIWFERHWRAKRSLLDPKAVGVMGLLSFVFVAFAMLASTLPSSGKLIRPDGKELPPNIFAIALPAVFFIIALLAMIGLLLRAAFRLLSSWRGPSGVARRRDAACLATYGLGAFLVAAGHFTLMKLWPG
jgi:hypothetical protein